MAQHKSEILDNCNDYHECVKLSFNAEFQNMIQVCIFVPFLHPETPKPVVIPKVADSRESEVLLLERINKVIAARSKIIERDQLAVQEVSGDRLNTRNGFRRKMNDPKFANN